MIQGQLLEAAYLGIVHPASDSSVQPESVCIAENY